MVALLIGVVAASVVVAAVYTAFMYSVTHVSGK